MIWKIKDSGSSYRPVFIMVHNIDAITEVSTRDDKIKIHMSSGKEWRADKSCLEELGNMINQFLEIE